MAEILLLLDTCLLRE